MYLSKYNYIIVLFFTFLSAVDAQQDTTSLLGRIPVDTIKSVMNMDAVYTRPFLQIKKTSLSLGGYAESHISYFSMSGVREGISFQIPRLTLFIASTITQRIKFLSEIELEEGGREINIEFASIDMEFHPLLNWRGGVIMNPIGAFNQNHDGPKWEFISRPLSATTIIPSTWSNVGFGLFGKYARRRWVWAYEIYITNGFDDKIISNDQNRTWLPASKATNERVTESFNGMPLITIKTAFKYRKLGEIGLSWMGGVYNKFQKDGLTLDSKRRVDVVSVDFNSILPSLHTCVNGEWVWALIDVPDTYTQQFGDRQQGGFLDVVQPILKRDLLGWKNATFYFVFRLEYVDYNVGQFRETYQRVFDEVLAVVPGLSFRPLQQTVIRFNYRYHWQTDLLGNPPAKTAGFQVGFSTYF